MDRPTAIVVAIVILVIIYTISPKSENYGYFDSNRNLPTMLYNNPNFGSMLDTSASGR